MSQSPESAPGQPPRTDGNAGQRPEPENEARPECDRSLPTLKWAQEEVSDMKSEARGFGDELTGFVFSAVHDDQTCPLCAHLDGMAIDINDPDILLLVPPLHEGCRCIALYQTRKMQDPLREKDFVRPPAELLDKYLTPGRKVRPD